MYNRNLVLFVLTLLCVLTHYIASRHFPRRLCISSLKWYLECADRHVHMAGGRSAFFDRDRHQWPRADRHSVDAAACCSFHLLRSTMSHTLRLRLSPQWTSFLSDIMLAHSPYLWNQSVSRTS